MIALDLDSPAWLSAKLNDRCTRSDIATAGAIWDEDLKRNQH